MRTYDSRSALKRLFFHGENGEKSAYFTKFSTCHPMDILSLKMICMSRPDVGVTSFMDDIYHIKDGSAHVWWTVRKARM